MKENNLVPFVSQWMTIQPSLFDSLDDEAAGLNRPTDAGPAPTLRMEIHVRCSDQVDVLPCSS